MLKKMRSWKFIVLVAVVAAAAISVSVFAGAIWSSDDAVHIKSSEVENSTLAIGTHLIHLSALNDQLYEIAEKSATDSGQTMPASSWLASMMAPMRRDTPIP